MGSSRTYKYFISALSKKFFQPSLWAVSGLRKFFISFISVDSSFNHPCGQFLDLENFHKFHLCGQFFYLRKFFHPSGQFFYLRKFSQVPIPRDSSFTLTFRVKALNNNSSLRTVFYLCQKVHPPGQFFNLEKNH